MSILPNDPAYCLDEMPFEAKVLLMLTILDITDQYFVDHGELATQAKRYRTYYIDSRLPRTRSGLAIVTRYGQPLMLVNPWGSLTFPPPCDSDQPAEKFLAHFSRICILRDHMPWSIRHPDVLHDLMTFDGKPLHDVVWPEPQSDVDAARTERELFRESQHLLGLLSGPAH